MAYEDPNAPSQPQTPAPATTPVAAPEKKSGSWDWLWPSIVAVIIVKLFGLVGGLVTFGCYYWLKPKLGTWGGCCRFRCHWRCCRNWPLGDDSMTPVFRPCEKERCPASHRAASPGSTFQPL